jgi:hypothetical protein
MNKIIDIAVMVIGLFLLAMMIDLAVLGITPAEFIADVKCLF